MSVNRFDKILPKDYNMEHYVPQEFVPNFEAWDQTLGQLQGEYNLGQSLADKTPNYIEADTEAAQGYISDMRGSIDKLTDMYASQDLSAARSKQADLIRKVRRDWQRGGVAFELESRVAQLQAQDKAIEEFYKDQPLLQSYYKQKLRNEIPEFFDKKTGRYNQIDAPGGMVRHVPQEEINQWMNQNIDNLKPSTLMEYGVTKQQLKNFSYLYRTGQIDGVTADRIINLLATTVPDEYLNSWQQYSNAQGRGVNERAFVTGYDKDGMPIINSDTYMGKLLIGATNFAYQKKNMKYGTFRDVAGENRDKYDYENKLPNLNVTHQGLTYKNPFGTTPEEVTASMENLDKTMQGTINEMLQNNPSLDTPAMNSAVEAAKQGDFSKLKEMSAEHGVSPDIINSYEQSYNDAARSKRIAQQRLEEAENRAISKVFGSEEEYEAFQKDKPTEALNTLQKRVNQFLGDNISMNIITELLDNPLNDSGLKSEQADKVSPELANLGITNVQEALEIQRAIKMTPEAIVYRKWGKKHGRKLKEYNKTLQEDLSQKRVIDHESTWMLPGLNEEEQQETAKIVRQFLENPQNIQDAVVKTATPGDGIDGMTIGELMENNKIDLTKVKQQFQFGGESATLTTVPIGDSKKLHVAVPLTIAPENKKKQKVTTVYIDTDVFNTPGINKVQNTPAYDLMTFVEKGRQAGNSKVRFNLEYLNPKTGKFEKKQTVINYDQNSINIWNAKQNNYIEVPLNQAYQSLGVFMQAGQIKLGK